MQPRHVRTTIKQVVSHNLIKHLTTNRQVAIAQLKGHSEINNTSHKSITIPISKSPNYRKFHRSEKSDNLRCADTHNTHLHKDLHILSIPTIANSSII